MMRSMVIALILTLHSLAMGADQEKLDEVTLDKLTLSLSGSIGLQPG